MKRLNELYDCPYDLEIKGIKTNSKEIEPGDLFVCTMGLGVDRHEFIKDAELAGAVAAVVSREVDCQLPLIKVTDTNIELPLVCRKFYDYPDNSIFIMGITGTDGKTSVASITQILMCDDVCGYIGTNGRRCKEFSLKTANTTPDSSLLYKYFREFLEVGCQYVAMEVSSEAILFKRLDNIEYQIGAYTNVTSEHLNSHKTFENYLGCKIEMFRHIKSDGFAVLNKDDTYFENFRQNCACQVLTYGASPDNTLWIKDFTIRPNQTLITYGYQGRDYQVVSPLLGDFNVYNLACALLICLASGKTIEELLPNIEKLFVSGRLAMAPNIGQNFNVMVDYAHTPNGIKKLLNFVHTLDTNRSIVVIGAPGERDPANRPVKSKVVCDEASHVIFTSQDPRSEDPLDIIKMMTRDLAGYDNYEIEVDRAKAITKAIEMAGPNDLVLILGKGNETYQQFKDKVIYFNDIEEVNKALKARVEREK